MAQSPLSDNLKLAALGLAIGTMVSVSTTNFVLAWEGKRNLTYLDIIGTPTSCVGHTGPDVEIGRTYTDAECFKLLDGDLVTHVTVMMRYVQVPLSEGEMTAYSSLVFNVGVGAFARSTLLRLLNSGDRGGACKQLLLFVKAGGKVIRGLERRRAAEYELCIEKPTRAVG